MSALALQPSAKTQPRPMPSQPDAVLAQRRSTLAGPGAIAVPALRDSGRPLDPSTRVAMESGFGRDLGHVRVHDDARAHDQAREMGALAYAAGNHIVFGEGSYRPGSPGGDALIAHEVAHTIQQSGVQCKLEGSLPIGADAALEAEADRAAAEVVGGGRAGTLTRLGAPAVFCASTSPPAPSASVQPAPAGGVSGTPTLPAVRLPAGMAAIKDDPPGVGTTELVVEVTTMTLPRVKGMGPWVKAAYKEAGDGRRLVFSPLIEGGRVAAFKEDSQTATYSGIWHRNFGFPSVQALGKAIKDTAKTDKNVADLIDPAKNKGVRNIVDGLAGAGLSAAKCDIDHIVEKQIGGTSIPSNLQLLLSSKNQESGRQTYQSLKAMVEEIRSPAYRGPGVKNLQLVFREILPAADTSDPSYEVESLLRSGAVKGGNAALTAAAAGSPVTLAAGGVGETVRLQDKGKSDIDEAAKRIVPGMRLLEYSRGPQGSKSKVDQVAAELDNRAIRASGATDAQSKVTLSAELDATAAPVGAAAGGTAAAENVAAAEKRVLKLPKGPKKIKFFYPYLSPGYLTKLELDDQGRASGEGHIEPSVKFLGNIKVAFGPDKLDMVAPIDVAQMNASSFMKPLASFFRFTDGKVAIDLVKFKPEGSLSFSIGPSAKPFILGTASATVDNGAFAANGTLTPAEKIPGIQAAAGEVSYRSDTGWAGHVRATSAAIPKSTVDARLGFRQSGARFQAYGEGGIKTQIGSSELDLRIGWSGGPVSYTGGVTVKKPLPFVEEVRLDGSYRAGVLRLTGKAPISWKNIAAQMTVNYTRKDGEEEGHFSGSAEVKVKTAKADGAIALNFDEDGRYWGKGSLSYQVTPNIRPTLGVELGKDKRVKVTGSVAINDIKLTDMWPKPGGERRRLLKAGVKFSVPTPVPGVTAYLEITGSLGVAYGVGPVMLKNVVFSGEAYPLEDDPQIKAQLKGKFSVPAFGELYGSIGASIGVEILLGAAGAKGSLLAKPALGVKGEGAVEFDAAYESGGFSFAAEAYAKGQMYAKLGIDLEAEIYAAWGALSHTWTFPVAAVQKTLGPELKVTIGRIAYGRDGTITWPSLSQIDIEPKEFDAMSILTDLVRESRAS